MSKKKQKTKRIVLLMITILLSGGTYGSFFAGEQSKASDNWDGEEYLIVEPGSDLETTFNLMVNEFGAASIEIYAYNYRVPILRGIWTSDHSGLIDEVAPIDRFYSYAEERTIKHLQQRCFNNLEADNLTTIDLERLNEEISCPIMHPDVALPVGFITIKAKNGMRFTPNQVSRLRESLIDLGELMTRR